MCAAFSAEPLGVDIERERFLDEVALARRFFSPPEADLISENRSQFLPLWTCREAAIKADGRGMSRLLESVSAAPGPSGFTVRIGGEAWEALHWREDHAHAALALRRIPELILWSDLR